VFPRAAGQRRTSADRGYRVGRSRPIRQRRDGGFSPTGGGGRVRGEAANLLIDRHGGGALVEADRMIDRMLELGDPEGRLVWRRIKRAIEQLQAAPTAVH